MERMPITKWTDGGWNSLYITLPSNGYWEPDNKAADCLSRLVELPHNRQATVQMLSATNYDGPAFHKRSRTTQCNITVDLTPQPKTDTVTPDITKVADTPDVTPKLLPEELKIDYKPYYRCRGQTHSVCTSPSIYQMKNSKKWSWCLSTH